MKDPQGRTSNIFDLLRLSAASMVLVTHSWTLLGLYPEDFIWRLTRHSFTASWLGLAIFFSVSGFLIDASAANSPDWRSFLRRRFLRLWPALAAVVLLSILVIGPLVSNLPTFRYFTSPATWFYLATLTIWGVRWKLPGAFPGNPLVEVNGSLWTLPYETTLYAVSWTLKKAGRHSTAILVGLLASGVALRALAFEQVRAIPFRPLLLSLDHLLEFGLLYLAGSCIRRFWKHQAALRVLFAILAIAWLACLGNDRFRIPLDYLVFPLGAILLGSCRIPLLDQASRWGDFSYGIYIWGFPIQQILIHRFGTGSFSPAGLTLATISIATAIAFASWHLVEKRALALKDRPLRFGRFRL